MADKKVKHIAVSPFPFRINSGACFGAVVTDEWCECGHLRSVHHDNLTYGQGKCGACDCRKFTFVARITKGGTK